MTQTQTVTATLRTMTPERAEFLGLPQGKALCPDCGAGAAIHEGYMNSPCPDCDGFLTIEIGVREKAYAGMSYDPTEVQA